MVNTTAAIMALPAPLDPIRLVGDEDKHATLLFLGETSTLPDDAKQVLTDSVQQASSMLFPFSERIRDVTRLGAELPPALVATLSDENLSQIRNLFMMNPSIKGYLGNAQQFPSFTPHVTLGHPDFTDEVILRSLAKNLFRVRFDRLAVWFNDEQIEFPLAFDNQDNIAMSDAIGEFLEHHGVKGQKWGVTKASRDTGGRRVLTVTGKGRPKVGESIDVGGKSHTITRASKSTDGTHVVVVKPTSKVTPSEKSILKVQGKNYIQRAMGDKEFYKKAAAVAAVTGTGLAIAAAGPLVLPIGVLTAAGGAAHFSAVLSGSTLAATRIGNIGNAINYRRRVRTAKRTVVHSELQHAAETTVQDVYNNMTPEQKDASATLIAAAVNGVDVSDEADLKEAWDTMTDEQHAAVYFIATVSDVDRESAASDTPVAHSDLVDKFLEHHGIKGMKWGVRRRPDASTGLVPRTSSADQISQDRILKKVKSGGVESLSNKDIQDYTRRLQLSQDLSKALASQSSAEKAKVDGFIKSFVKKQGSRQFNRVADKALDIAVEKALESAGLKLGKKGANPDLADLIVKTSGRLKPKKGK